MMPDLADLIWKWDRACRIANNSEQVDLFARQIEAWVRWAKRTHKFNEDHANQLREISFDDLI